MSYTTPFNLLRQHQTGSWGLADYEANAEALQHGNRLISIYEVQGSRIWIITEHDRSATTLLTAEEY